MVYKNSKPSFQMIHWCCSGFLAVVCLITFGIDLYVNIALTYPHRAHHKYANYTPHQLVYQQYMTQITPPSWVFTVWIVLYVLLAIWFLYVFYLMLCRQLCSRDNKSPLFPAIFWFLFILVNVLNGIWLALFVHRNLVASGIVFLIMIAVLYALNFIAFNVCWMGIKDKDSSNYNSNDCEANDDDAIQLSSCEITLLRMLTLNALPFYALWCSLIACIQWAAIFKYYLFHWSDNVSCVVSLAIFSLILLIYWSLDLLFVRKYTVWTWLSCFALIVGFSGMISKRHSIGGMHAPGLLFAFILLIVSCVAVVIKLFSICMCCPNPPNPRFSRI